MSTRYSPEALADLEALVEWLAERNPAAARKLGEQILDTVDRLAARDFDGPKQTLTTGEHVHSWPVPPVRIYYQREDGSLLVLRIYHQARAPITR